MEQDVLGKRAAYISKNNELLQEFHFAPSTLVNVNNIYNTHLYGSTLWNLFSKEVNKIEKLWNVSQRNIYKLHRKMHKYLIEPITGTPHIVFSLYKRFINFTKAISSSKKSTMKEILECVKYDCQSTIGHNLRKLMLRYGKYKIEDLDIDVTHGHLYEPIPNDEKWRINIINELVDVKEGNKILPNFGYEEINCYLDFICTS